MALYEPLAKLIDQHKVDISRQSADRALATDIPVYKNNGATVDYVAPRIVPTLEMICRYVVHGDPNEYRDHIIQLTHNRLNSGYDAEDIILVGDFMFEVIKEKIDQDLTGPARENERNRYNRRLDGIRMLGSATVIAVRAGRIQSQQEKK